MASDKSVVVIGGDGIGPEVARGAVRPPDPPRGVYWIPPMLPERVPRSA